MKLIVGLGNPGEKYKNTRHNVGFVVLEALTKDQRLKTEDDKNWKLNKNFNSLVLCLSSSVLGYSVIFAKPQTFMNLSGEAVSKMMKYYKIGTDDVIVVCDDLDLPLGTIRVRLEGSSGGHNGMQSIIDHIGNKFARIRIGIGSNKKVISHQSSVISSSIPAEEYVLQNFTKDEIKIIDKSIDKTVEILLEWINWKELREKTVKIEVSI